MDRLQLLEAFGRELRRPHADYLQEGVYELRARSGRVQYRILYFFHGKDVVVLVHGLTKEGAVPGADLARALERKAAFEAAPHLHTAEDEDEQEEDAGRSEDG